MSGQQITWCVFVALLAGNLPGQVEAGGKAKAGPEPPPSEVVKAWTDAGAHFAWERVREDGRYMEFAPGPLAPGAVPVFGFGTWKEGVIARLPDAGVPFGLNLNVTRVTSAGLAELTRLKSLRVLELRGTSVTDTGIQELADLKDLQWLSLEGTPVTDVGLKDMAGLKGLQSLYLRGTQVVGSPGTELEFAL